MAEKELSKQEFLKIICSLLSVQRSIRRVAQARIQAIPLQKRAAHLLDAIYNREVEDIVRQVATIHLRIIISEDFEEFYNQRPHEFQVSLKNKILNSLKYEVNKDIRMYIGEISIELARQFMESEASNSWPEFLDYVFLNVNHTLQFRD